MHKKTNLERLLRVTFERRHSYFLHRKTARYCIRELRTL